MATSYLTVTHKQFAIKKVAACAIFTLALATFTFLLTFNAHAQGSVTAVVSSAAANPYGLGAIWSQGDWIAKLCLLLLAIMSIGSWYVLASKLLELRRNTGTARQPTARLTRSTTLLTICASWKLTTRCALSPMQA